MVAIYSPTYHSVVRRELNTAWADPATYDLRYYFDWDTAPIAVIRSWVNSVQLGCYSRLFGEQFERRFAASTYFYYSNRDRKASVDRLVSDLNISFVEDFILTNGERTHINLCISQILNIGLTTSAVTDELVRMVTWLLPSFANNIVINVCETAETDLIFNTAGVARTIIDFGA